MAQCIVGVAQLLGWSGSAGEIEWLSRGDKVAQLLVWCGSVVWTEWYSWGEGVTQLLGWSGSALVMEWLSCWDGVAQLLGWCDSDVRTERRSLLWMWRLSRLNSELFVLLRPQRQTVQDYQIMEETGFPENFWWPPFQDVVHSFLSSPCLSK
jgi:hypothetical protein